MTGPDPTVPAPTGAPPELSIVVPAFEEEGNVAVLYQEVRRVLDERVSSDWEMVFVDDGSRDRTWERVQRLSASDPRVRGVRFSRNFGHQKALLAGLEHARGRAVISMDGDLQHPPGVLPDLIHQWRAGYKIVHTVRRDAAGLPWLKRVTSRWFYRIYSLLSGVPLEPGMADFRLLDREVLDQLLRFGEQGLFLRGLVQWMGFRAARVEFECAPRRSGITKYSPRRMLSLAWNGISSFSLVPLRLATLVGFFTSVLAFGFLVYAVVAKLGGFQTMPGWASGVSIVSFLFGVLFMLLGVMGEYLGKILLEVKHRPRYLVQQRVGLDGSPAAVPLPQRTRGHAPSPGGGAPREAEDPGRAAPPTDSGRVPAPVQSTP